MLGLGIIGSAPVDAREQLKVFQAAGFDAFFSIYGRDRTETLRKAADELGLVYQSIHAPYVRMHHLWYASAETESAKQELKDCVAEAAQYGVPIVVMHPFIGFQINEANAQGVENFREVVDCAAQKGVKIAFENVEGEAYLEALMEAFKDEAHVGFCWDTGHEMCYNRGKDMLAQYGDRLIATHINDNLGVRGESITFYDDLHFVPFDGVKDWQDAMRRLDRCGYEDILTFELKIDKEQDAECGTAYSAMEFPAYVRLVYDRAQRLLRMRP